MKSNGGAMRARPPPKIRFKPLSPVQPAGCSPRPRSASRPANPICSRSTWAAPAPTSASSIDGQQKHTTEYEIEWGIPAAIPLIDIKSIGAGGGSIAWIDAGGFFRVGPQSAGASPGSGLLRQGRDRTDRHRRQSGTRDDSIPAISSAAE